MTTTISYTHKISEKKSMALEKWVINYGVNRNKMKMHRKMVDKLIGKQPCRGGLKITAGKRKNPKPVGTQQISNLVRVFIMDLIKRKVAITKSVIATRGGAGDRTRTGTLSPAVDFESTTSTIPSHRQISFLLLFSGRLTGCGARYLPRLIKAFVSYRPLPIAQVASSATGGAPIAPHHTGRCLDSIH